MRTRLLIGYVLVSIVLLGLYSVSYTALMAHRATNYSARQQNSGIWSLPPIFISVIAGEFKGLIADYLTVEAGAQTGAKVIRTPEGRFVQVKIDIDWNTIHKLLVASQYLDPSFQQTYTMAEGLLPWEVGMISETNDILRTAAKNRPWDWQPMRFIGFNTYYFLKNPAEAGKIFMEAANTPNAPSYLAILGARLAMEGGETHAAIALLKSMLVGKKASDPGYDDIMIRLHALEGVAVLENGVISYKNKFGNLPETLSHLVSTGIIQNIPENPYNTPFCLDKKGRIYFDNVNCKN